VTRATPVRRQPLAVPLWCARLGCALLCCALPLASCTWGENEVTPISGEDLEQRFGAGEDSTWRRGDRGIGDVCARPTDCASGLCLGGFCTQDCTSAVCPSSSVDAGAASDEEVRSSQCTSLLYPCLTACAGASDASACEQACEDSPAQLCLRSCEGEDDCAKGTDCVRVEGSDTHRCLPWAAEWFAALECLAYGEFAAGSGTPPDSCQDSELEEP
jgi:hypothetical protein